MLIVTDKFINKLKAKDNEAFTKLYNEYVKLVYHIAYSYTHNKEDAEDITSNVFIRVVESIENYKEQGKFKEWICQITRNLSINFVTRNKHKDTIVDEQIVSTCFASEESSNDDLIRLFKDNLDDVTVSIMILRFIYNYKFREIALYLDLSIGKVQSLYYAGLEILRKVY